MKQGPKPGGRRDMSCHMEGDYTGILVRELLGSVCVYIYRSLTIDHMDAGVVPG